MGKYYSSNLVSIDAARLNNAVRKSGKTKTEIASEIGFSRASIGNAITRGKINKLNLKVLSEYLGKDPEYFILRPEEESPKEEPKQEPKSEDIALLYKGISDLNRHLFDISTQLKELNGKTEACRVGLINESVHLYDIKQLLISLNKELMGESK